MTYARKASIFFKKDKLSISTHHLSLIVHDAFIPYFPCIYYDITIRLVYDYYVIHIPCLSYPTPIHLGLTRITSPASATTSYHVQFLPAKTAISAISAIFYPKYIRTNRYLRTYFSTVTIIYNQWLRKHGISSYGLSANTFSAFSKVRRNLSLITYSS